MRGAAAEGRPEARAYGARLLQGGLLRQLGHRRGFRDDPALLYCFAQGKGPLPGEPRQETLPDLRELSMDGEEERSP